MTPLIRRSQSAVPRRAGEDGAPGQRCHRLAWRSVPPVHRAGGMLSRKPGEQARWNPRVGTVAPSCAKSPADPCQAGGYRRRIFTC